MTIRRILPDFPERVGATFVGRLDDNNGSSINLLEAIGRRNFENGVSRSDRYGYKKIKITKMLHMKLVK